ncbi:MAG: hypothetical protein H0T62_08845 [Parachlamydiaceae bacterium]|nr:hypothetical protein [Parachlamydiaceae bacterium]
MTSVIPEKFPFKEALSKLNEYFPDKTSEYYQFNHAALHFFCHNTLFIVPSTEETKAALFKRFYRMRLKDRLFFDEYIEAGNSIQELISTGFPYSPQKVSLKKGILKFLGEEKIQEINQVLKLLPSFTDDQNGTLLSVYIKFIETANRAKEASEKAIEKGEATADEIILELANCRNKLDLHDSKNEEIIELYFEIYHKCIEKFTLSSALKHLINIIGSSPTKKTRGQFSLASAEQEFLKTFQKVLKRYSLAMDYDQKSFQKWVLQGKFPSTILDEQKQLNNHLEVPFQHLINQLPNANQENSAVITYLNKINNVLLTSIQHHQLVMQIVNNLTLNISESIRRKLIISLKTPEICQSFTSFFSSFPPSFLATVKDILFFSTLTHKDPIRDLFTSDAWKISYEVLEEIVKKIKSKNSYLELREEEVKNINTIYLKHQCITKSKTDSRMPKTFNKKLKKLKIISSFFEFYSRLEIFKITMRLNIGILNRIKFLSQNDLVVDKVESKMTDECKDLIYNLKKFRLTTASLDEINAIQNKCLYSLTEEQAELLNPIHIIEMDEIIAHYMFCINVPNPYSQYYLALADALHNTFKESFEEVEVIDSQIFPTLSQLKFAIKLMQNNMKFLLISTLTLKERIDVAELLQIIILGQEKTKTISPLTSEFSFTWKEAQNYTTIEELDLLPNTDILHSLLDMGSFKGEIENSRNQLLKCFFNDYNRSGITEMDIMNKGILNSLGLKEAKGFFDSLRSAYFDFVSSDIEALKKEIIYNQTNHEFVSASLTNEQFKQLLLSFCLDGQNQKVEEIVTATTFTHEEYEMLKTLSPETEKEIIKSLFRIKILQCLLFWNQAIAPMMLNQKIQLELDQMNVASVCCKVNEQGLYGNALGRKWVVDGSLNSMRHTLIYHLKQASENTTECTYSQTLSLINMTSSNPKESKVTLASVDTLYVGPSVDIKTFDKLAIALG